MYVVKIYFHKDGGRCVISYVKIFNSCNNNKSGL